ncbi:hypothetical protein [Bauldia sp.]|uniref:hypothetical protein n=1 Tax=Bauldia sp. TaxID=2575872 RepID=UPI003BABD560
MLRIFAIAAMLVAGPALAEEAPDDPVAAIEGTYLLIQHDGFQRALSFDRSGNIIQASDLQTLIGFTTSLGAWATDGPGKAKATVISFNFDVDGSDEIGATEIAYTFTFSDLVDGKYQRIAGALDGRTYADRQDPLAPTAEPVRVFGYTFEGRRVTAD